MPPAAVAAAFSSSHPAVTGTCFTSLAQPRRRCNRERPRANAEAQASEDSEPALPRRLISCRGGAGNVGDRGEVIPVDAVTQPERDAQSRK